MSDYDCDGFSPSSLPCGDAGYIASADGQTYYVSADAGDAMNAAGTSACAPLSADSMANLGSYAAMMSAYGSTLVNVDEQH